jgi:hypothetical protein
MGDVLKNEAGRDLPGAVIVDDDAKIKVRLPVEIARMEGARDTDEVDGVRAECVRFSENGLEDVFVPEVQVLFCLRIHRLSCQQVHFLSPSMKQTNVFDPHGMYQINTDERAPQWTEWF